LSEYSDHYLNQRLVPVIAPIGEAEPETYSCCICGFVIHEVGECPSCKLAVQAQAA
jgi:hypothetical protein